MHSGYSKTNGLERLAHGKSRRRLRKRIGRMKPAEEGRGVLYDGRGDIQKQNGPERLAWPESHMENGGSFAKESSRLNLQSGRASFPSSQRHGWRASEPETLEVLRVQMSKSQLAVLKLAGVQSGVNVLLATCMSSSTRDLCQKACEQR